MTAAGTGCMAAIEAKGGFETNIKTLSPNRPILQKPKKFCVAFIAELA
ncbi:MAG: hypothetical protein R3A13_01490 [Bdellovibrionota bacterium]